MDHVQIQKAISMLQISFSLINKQIEIDSPWILFQKSDLQNLSLVLSSYLQCFALITLYILPIMPTTAKTIWIAIGANGDINHIAKKYFIDNQSIPKDGFFSTATKLSMLNVLFPKILK
jgi:methionyl-tRNA synthetase